MDDALVVRGVESIEGDLQGDADRLVYGQWARVDRRSASVGPSTSSRTSAWTGPSASSKPWIAAMCG